MFIYLHKKNMYTERERGRHTCVWFQETCNWLTSEALNRKSNMLRLVWMALKFHKAEPPVLCIQEQSYLSWAKWTESWAKDQGKQVDEPDENPQRTAAWLTSNDTVILYESCQDSQTFCKPWRWRLAAVWTTELMATINANSHCCFVLWYAASYSISGLFGHHLCVFDRAKLQYGKLWKLASITSCIASHGTRSYGMWGSSALHFLLSLFVCWSCYDVLFLFCV